MPEAKLYVCYDIKGIQQHIFSVPKLRYIIGGSSQIDMLDRKTFPEFAKRSTGIKKIFCGGGRGTLKCDDCNLAKKLIDEILFQADRVGLDVRISTSTKLAEAIGGADEQLYCFDPGSLDGEPCPVSGLFPVKPKTGSGELKEHSKIKARRSALDTFRDDLLSDLISNQSEWLPENLRCSNIALEFFKNVSADKVLDGVELDPDEEKTLISEGDAGDKALGGRGRWAIVAMDGNDMGSQHRVAEEYFAAKGKPEDHEAWLTAMSDGLSKCTYFAFLNSLLKILKKWVSDNSALIEMMLVQRRDRFDIGIITLPVRPLVLGGDDLVLLCHCAYAFELVSEIRKEFKKLSGDENATHVKKFGNNALQLWPATGGQLSISAGILFVPVNYPIYTAIQYSESLLKSAKGRGRRVKEALAKTGNVMVDDLKMATPAALDWEQVTEGLLDSPANRRRRELEFDDQDLKPQGPDDKCTVLLTERPYLFDDFDKLISRLDLSNLENIPRSVRSKILPSLRNAYYDREVFRAQIGKHYPESLFAILDEKNLEWWRRMEKKDPAKATTEIALSTSIVDALLILEEGHRAR